MTAARPLVLACLIAAGQLAPASAATYTWVGVNNDDWSKAGVWGTGSPSLADDIANIGVSAALTIKMGEITVGRINTTRTSGSGTLNVVLGDSGLTTDILTLSTTTGGPILDVGVGTQMFMFATLAGTQGFTKQGAGVLTFRYNNTASTFSGNVTLAGGGIILQSDSSLGAAENDLVFTANSTLEAGNTSATATPVTLASTRSLTVNSGVTATLRAGNTSSVPSNLIVAGVVSGAGGVTISSANAGVGSVTLSGANTYTGTTTVDRATLILAGGNAIANSGLVQVNNLAGSVLQLNASETVGGLAGGGTTGGTVNLQTFNLAVNTSTDRTYAGTFTGTTGKLIKQGSGTLTLTGTASHTGGVQVSDNGGILRIENAGAIGSGTIQVSKTSVNTGTLELALSGANTFANAFANFASATSPLNGAGTAHIRNVTGNNTFTAVLNLTSGGGNGINLESVAGGADDRITFSGGIDYKTNDTRILSLMGSGLGVISGVLSNTGGVASVLALHKSGAGTWTLSGANAHKGLTQIAEGALRITHASALGTTDSGTTVASGSALELQGGIAIGAEALSIAGTGVSSGGALRSLGGANSWSGSLNLTAAASIIADTGALTVSGAIYGSQNLTVGGAGDAVLSGVLGISSGSLTKVGAGTLTLSGDNTFSGGVALSAGTLLLGHAKGLGTGAVSVASGATLALGGFSPANSLSILSGGTLDLGEGDFSGNVSLVSGSIVNGTGTLGLSGDVDLTGVSLGAGLTLNLLGGGDVNLGDVAYAGDVAYTGGSFAGTNFTGNLVVSGEARTLGSGIAAGTVKLTAGNGALLAAGFARPILYEGGVLAGLDSSGYAGLITVGGNATLDVDQAEETASTNATYSVLAGSTLKGSAIFTSQVSVAGTLAPGNSPGLMEFTDGLDLDATSVTEWEFDSAIDIIGVDPGSNTDLIVVSGGEFLLAAGATLKVVAPGDVDYAADAWDVVREFAVVEVTGTGSYAAASSFTLDTSAAGLFSEHGGWSLFQDASGVDLIWTPAAIPEPSTYGLILGGLALAGAALRRRRQAGQSPAGVPAGS